MKDKIMLFIIGILLGAVISTIAFYVYTTTTSCNCNNNTQMNGGTPPEMPNNQNGQPPEKPGDTQNNTNTEQNNNQ